jgi:subtilisin family serine protease
MVARANPSNWRRFGPRPGLLFDEQSDCGPDPLVEAMDRTRRIPLLLAVVVGVLALGGPGSLAAPAKKPVQEAVPGEILIGFRGDATSADQKNVFKSIGAAEKKSFKKIHGSLAHVRPDAVEATLAKLRQDPRVRYAEPNFLVHADATPNDPAFTNLWGLNNTGQAINGFPGTPDADIDAAEAWNVTTGSAGVTVAVIDTGVDWSHPDLSGQIWINPGENCGGCRTDGIDNDHNGYVDDWRGWDFVGDDNNPMDDHGHGTHVAGTIGAAGNNGVGVAGVNWNVRLMPIKFLNAQGSGSTADAIGAVLYAAQNGADVMNNSWAGGDYSQALGDAITVADQHNSLFVAAAGNDGSDNDAEPTYPASYDLPNVVAVAATDNSDDLAYFSNVGRQSVDLGAPGVDIYSTWPGSGYQFLSGTSMATPQVAGAAALAKAAFPSATAVGLKALLLDSVDPSPALADETTTGGRLNVATAVACNSSPQVWLDSPGPGFVVDVGTPIAFSAIATNCAESGGVNVTANANGAPVALTPRGDGLYTGTFTPTTRGSVTFSVTATAGGSSSTRNITGTATQAYPISAGGSPVTVTTTSPGENAQLRFAGTAGERISLSLSNVTMSAVQISLLQPNGSSIATTYAGTSGGFLDTRTLPTTGAYTISVDPLGNATGSITLTLYYVPPDATATATPGGGATSISTSTPGQNGRIAFTASAGQRISAQISGVTFSFAFVSVLKPDGTTLVTNRIVGTAGTFVDTTTLPAAGTYSIVVDPQGAATGSASVTLYDVPPDAGGPITPGGAAVTVSTTAPGQNGRLTFNGTAGQRISLKIASVSYSSATALLLGPDGKAVGGSTLFGTGGGFVDTRILPSTGAYALVVDPPNMTTGSATFTLYDVPPDVTGTIAPSGAAVTASMTTPGQNAKLTFDGAAGQRISLKIGPATVSTAYVSIARPDGGSLVSNILFSTSGAFVDAKVLPVTGTYTLTVDPQGAATGTATLMLYDVPADAAATLTIGGPAQAISMSTPGQNGRVTFAGNAGQAISIKITGVTVATAFVSVLKPDGTTLVSNTLVGTPGRTIAATLPVAGTYTIVIDPQSSATGNMTFSL